MESPKRTRPPRSFTEIKAELRGAAGSGTGSIRDLGPGGMRIRTALRTAVDEHLGLTLLLPAPHRFSLQTQVRWVREEAPGSYLVGVRVVPATDTQRKLQLLLQEVRSGKLGVLRASTRRITKA